MSKSSQSNKQVCLTLAQANRLHDAVLNSMRDLIEHHANGRMSGPLTEEFLILYEDLSSPGTSIVDFATRVLRLSTKYNEYRHGHYTVSLENLLVKLPSQPSNKRVRKGA